MKLTEEQKDAAYERGWVDSLTAYFAPISIAMGEQYYYLRGWHTCADWRWEDPSRRGVALDKTYRRPRT